MRKFAAGGALVVVMLLTGSAPGRAFFFDRPSYEGPWCVLYDQGFDSVQEDCSMPSFEACRIERARWGSTAFCHQNPRFPGYWGKPVPQPHHRKPRHRH